MEDKIEIRDFRKKEYFLVDDEYLNGYSRLLKPGATLVYLALCRHANKDQISWPSVDLLCEKLNLSRQTVLNGIKELEKWSIISVTRSKDEQTKRQNSNIYILLDKKSWNQKPSLNNRLGAESKLHQKPSLNNRLEVNTLRSKHNTVLTYSGQKPDFRQPDIQKLWEFGLKAGFSNTKQTQNRYAIKRLLRQKSDSQLQKAVEFSQSIRLEAYAPQINNWLDLEEKYLKLRDFVIRKSKPKESLIAEI